MALRLPNITGRTAEEQLTELKGYLHSLVYELQIALERAQGVSEPQKSEKKETAKNGNHEAESTFSSIKALIIKSADIVNAYYDTISKRLEGVYVAKSDFGTFTEQTAQSITESATALERLFENVSVLETDISAMTHQMIQATAHVRTGLLYYDADGIPVYGMEIGQKNVVDGNEVFHKFARFTANKISFYDQNGLEVAYISDYKLHITSVEIKGALTVGRYTMETGNGLAFKWI